MGGQATPDECKPKKADGPVLDKDYEQLVLKMPWLQHLDTSNSFVQNATAAAAASKGSTPRAGEAPDFEVDDEEVFNGLIAVEKGRLAEAAVASERSNIDFVSKGVLW